MKETIAYRPLAAKSAGFWGWLIALAAVMAVGGGAALHMEHSGHAVTGMNNQVVWGLPHVFAVFLIVAASGALNSASIASVFGKKLYKPLGRLSGLLAISLLAGGLVILVLDLGRPERLTVAMTTYNFKSIFAWNIILYNGFFAIVAVYLILMMWRKFSGYSSIAGTVAFVWRIILTTGTGSIFGFLVARETYFGGAIMAPMFVTASLSLGTAFFLLVLMGSYTFSGRPLGDFILRRLGQLMGVFCVAVIYFLAVQAFTNLYAAEDQAPMTFMLLDGGIYTTLYWIGMVVIGNAIPAVLLLIPAFRRSRANIAIASALVLIGGLAMMYVFIIGSQAYPLSIFPGWDVSSPFFDGQVNAYFPSIWELLLGIGGIALALAIVTVAVAALGFLPTDLSDRVMDPHYDPAKADEADSAAPAAAPKTA